MPSYGCDFSHFNVVASFHLVAASLTAKSAGGQPFVYLKATESNTFVDPEFAAYRTRSESLNVRAGAYHFLHPSIDGEVQARFYLATLGKLRRGELAPAIDAESTPGWKANDPGVINDFAKVMLSEFGECKIYTSPGWWAGMFGKVDWSAYSYISRCDGWFAQWDGNSNPPQIVKPFKSWQLKQYGEKGDIPGAGGGVDTDVWNGMLPAA